jgi:serine protease Do
MRPIRATLSFVVALSLAGPLAAQPSSAEHQRSGPKVLQAFRDIVAKASDSTVRVQCDGRDVSLGTVVGADGWVLTKASDLGDHVACRFRDGRTLTAQVVGVQEAFDLALLKVDAKGLKPIEWAPSKEAHVGQFVAAPAPTAEIPIAVGVLSVGTRKFRAGDQPPRNLSTNSGFLGVGLAETEGGAKIIGVNPTGPAAKAGLKVGDIVVEADGKKVLDNESLINAVQRHHPGEELTLKVKRGMAELDMKATLDKLPRGFFNPQERMGNALSNRRGGFPSILQHDTVLKPADCGGPLVDLDGKAVGINIARAGRTETYAIPSDDVVALLPDLKSGKLAPTVAAFGPTSPAPRKLDPNVLLRDANRLSQQDALRGGRYSRSYTVKLTAGDKIEILLESLEFDAYLHLEDNAGKKIAENDDISKGVDLNARIVFSVPRDDSYRIIVTTCEPDETGNYELSVRRLTDKK